MLPRTSCPQETAKSAGVARSLTFIFSLCRLPEKEWAAAGLRVPSTIRLSRLDCLEQSLFRKRLGFLAATDRNEIQRIWSSEIRLDF
jgi:hypothetical protein